MTKPALQQTLLGLAVVLAVHLAVSPQALALDIKRSVLPNGLTILQVERHTLPIVMVDLLIRAGSVDEPPAKAGLANLTAALITEGTAKRSARQISEETEFIGASLHASADSDYTSITLSVLKKDVDKGFDLLSDVLLRPAFREEEVKRNKDLIKGSLRQSEEDPSFLASRAFRKAVFGQLPYGRLVSGETATIDAITADDIRSFHETWYRPNNAILAVVGDVTPEELSRLIDRFMAGWKRGEHQKEPGIQLPETAKKTFLIEKDLTQANILFGHNGISRGNPDYYAVSVMNYILGGGGFSSRLMQRVRDELGLAYDIHSYFSAHKEGGSFQVGVQTKNASAPIVIAEIRKQLERMRTEPVSDQELDDAKAYLTGSFPRRLDTNRKIADLLPLIEFYDLGLDYIDRYAQTIRAVTKEDILRVARKYLDPDKAVLVVVARQAEAKIEEKAGAKP